MSNQHIDPESQLECTCGFVFNLMRPFEKYAHYVFQQRDLARYLQLQTETREYVGEENPTKYQEQLDKIKEQSTFYGEIYECPECGRVIWIRKGQNSLSTVLTDFSEYVPQTKRTKMAYESDNENPKRQTEKNT